MDSSLQQLAQQQQLSLDQAKTLLGAAQTTMANLLTASGDDTVVNTVLAFTTGVQMPNLPGSTTRQNLANQINNFQLSGDDPLSVDESSQVKSLFMQSVIAADAGATGVAQQTQDVQQLGTDVATNAVTAVKAVGITLGAVALAVAVLVVIWLLEKK